MVTIRSGMVPGVEKSTCVTINRLGAQEKNSIFARFCMGILARFFLNVPRTEKNNFVDKVASEYP